MALGHRRRRETEHRASFFFSKSPSRALAHPFLGEGSPKIDYRKQGYPFSNLSTGGPSLFWGVVSKEKTKEHRSRCWVSVFGDAPICFLRVVLGEGSPCKAKFSK